MTSHPPYELKPGMLPVKVDGKDQYTFGVARIFIDDDTGFRGPSLFTLINPKIRLDNYAPTRHLGQLSVEHPFAKDVDGDSCKLAFLEIDSLSFIHTYDAIYKFRGWLIKSYCYNPDMPTPFDNITEKDEAENYSANRGYPFLPPEMNIRGLDLPFPVTIEICYGADGALRDWLAGMEGVPVP